MIRPNEPYATPNSAPARLNRISNDRWGACRAIRPIPVHMRAQLELEPRGDARIMQADVVIEMRGLDAELHFREDGGTPRLGGRTGTAVARLLAPGECFIPTRTAAQVPASDGVLLGVEFRDSELKPLGKVVPLPPQTVGTASIEASLDIPAAISVSFSWVDSDPQSGPEVLLGGEMRFLRGVIGRLILRTETPSRPASHGHRNVRDVTFLKPGQVIHFPDQFTPVRGEARELARIRYRFGASPAAERGGPDM